MTAQTSLELGSPSKGEFKAAKQVFVEGRDEVLVLRALIRFLELDEIEVRDYGGKPKLRAYLKTVPSLSGFSIVTSLAVIADADNSVTNTRKQIVNALKDASLPQPSRSLLASTKGGLKVSYLILPDGTREGMLEDVCLDSVRGKPELACADALLDCVRTFRSDWPKENVESKARVHAYLATMETPDLRLGEAAEKGYWDFGGSAFEPLKNLLTAL